MTAVSHAMTFAARMRPDQQHPESLEATGVLEWSCTCGKHGECAAKDEQATRRQHYKK